MFVFRYRPKYNRLHTGKAASANPFSAFKNTASEIPWGLSWVIVYPCGRPDGDARALVVIVDAGAHFLVLASAPAGRNTT